MSSYGAVRFHDPKTPGTLSQNGFSRLQALSLVLLAFFTTGSHFGKHSVSGLGPEIMKYLNVQRLEFGFLFSLQQVPGIILPVVGGFALSYFSLVPAAMVLSFFIFMSMLLCALSINLASYNTLLMGRFLFGVSDGLFTTVQGAIIAKCFKNYHVSTAFGIMLLVSRTSSFAGFSVPPIVLERFGLAAAMWLSVLPAALSLLATFAFFLLVSQNEEHQMGLDAPVIDIQSFSVSRLFGGLRIPFWVISYTFMTIASATFTFIHFAPDIFSDGTRGVSVILSAFLSGLLMLFAGLASPLVGLAQDKFGRRPYLLMFSSFCATLGLLFSVIVLKLETVTALSVSLVLLPLTLGLAVGSVTLLSCVAISVPVHSMPLALGVYKSMENLGMAIIHTVVGALRDMSSSYIISLFVLAILAASALIPLSSLKGMLPILDAPASRFNTIAGLADDRSAL